MSSSEVMQAQMIAERHGLRLRARDEIRSRPGKRFVRLLLAAAARD